MCGCFNITGIERYGTVEMLGELIKAIVKINEPYGLEVKNE